MPNKCCVPGCKGNYSNGPKVRVFSFPSDKGLCKKWLTAISRQNFTPTKHTKICELHFPKENILWTCTEKDSKTGQIVTVNLKRPRLKTNTIPSEFPNCLKKSSKSDNDCIVKEENLEVVVEEHTIAEFPECEEESLTIPKSECYTDYDDFFIAFSSFQIPEGWYKIIDKEKVTLFKLIHTPGPVLTYAIIVGSDLMVETFLYGKQITVSVDTLTTPFSLSNVNEIKIIAEEIDACISEDSSDNSGNNRENNILNHVSNIIDNLKCDEDSALFFISEQLKLRTSLRERRRYSTNTLILSSILDIISPQAYKFLIHSGFLKLPNLETIKSITDSLLTDSTTEQKQSSLVYARNAFKLLNKNEEYMILSIDEIYIKPYLDQKGRNNVDSSNNSSNATYVFMLTGINSNFKELAYISSTSILNHEMLFTLIKKLIMNLECIGYKIFCVVSNNSEFNIKAMNNFADNKKLSIVYPHPVDNTRPLFYLFDSVHLLKCIYNNWVDYKPHQILHYPDFESGIERSAKFQSLKTLRDLEKDRLYKLGYSLDLKALFPSNLEKLNINVVLKIFNPFIVQALTIFGSHIDKSKDTADFINTVLTWWKIVNVKIPPKGQGFNDLYQQPITATNLNDPKVEFLDKMLNWLEIWKRGKFSNKLTPHTYMALTHTIYGLLEVIKYCFEELNIGYVLCGKFQTNEFEYKFGECQQLPGSQYKFNVFIRHLYESGQKLTIQSLLTLKSHNFGVMHIVRFHENFDIPEEEHADSSFRPLINVEARDVEKVVDEMPVITYLGSYCCYIALKTIQCEFCKQNLVYDTDELVVEDNYCLIKSLNPGGLLYPQDAVVELVLINYIICNKLLEEYEEDFLNVHNKMHFLYWLVSKYVKEKGNLLNFRGCQTHSKESIGNIIITCTTNTLLRNYCGKGSAKLGKQSKNKT